MAQKMIPTAAPTAARPWTPRVAVQLTVLAAAAFIYVTAELAPVGALPALAGDLQVSEAMVGTLVAGYALVAAVMTVPLVRLTAHWSRRRVLLLTLTTLTVAQTVSALAPDFLVLGAGRISSALTHGLMWSVIAPIGVRLVPPSHAGRATTAVYVGSALALVVGSPLTAAMSQLWGWRPAFAVIALAAAAVTVAARLLIPVLPAEPGRVSAAGRRWSNRRRPNRRLHTLCGLTVVGVTAHFIAYTFIVVIIRDVIGVSGARLAWLLVAYGVAGLAAMALLARPLDRRPKPTMLAALTGMSAALLVLTGLATWAAPGGGAAVLLFGAVAITLWGAMATALPPMLQSAAMRVAPEDSDAASGLYVAAFQAGIMAGSLAGGFLYDTAGIAVMVGISALLVVGASAGVAASRGLFDAPNQRRQG
ncbi:MFS transporter [Mycolicibacterium chitae]|uniref:Sugar transporter family protein n=2 Tax=Mycolicibacterium chitae TaxID=1792 RepID=A0A448ICG1_MYCCI|nr:MFS transporter [Mycolicibacterium chitae]VEG50155.1 sugar transporter family protein [Mycolicibacterium chitae]